MCYLDVFSKYEHLCTCGIIHVKGSCWCSYSSMLFIETRSLNQIYDSMMWLVMLTSLPGQLSPPSKAIFCHLILLQFIWHVCIFMYLLLFLCVHVPMCVCMCTNVWVCAIKNWHLLFYTEWLSWLRLSQSLVITDCSNHFQ